VSLRKKARDAKISKKRIVKRANMGDITPELVKQTLEASLPEILNFSVENKAFYELSGQYLKSISQIDLTISCYFEYLIYSMLET
jgi:hypothetical protein